MACVFGVRLCVFGMHFGRALVRGVRLVEPVDVRSGVHFDEHGSPPVKPS